MYHNKQILDFLWVILPAIIISAYLYMGLKRTKVKHPIESKDKNIKESRISSIYDYYLDKKILIDAIDRLFCFYAAHGKELNGHSVAEKMIKHGFVGFEKEEYGKIGSKIYEFSKDTFVNSHGKKFKVEMNVIVKVSYFDDYGLTKKGKT